MFETLKSVSLAIRSPGAHDVQFLMALDNDPTGDRFAWYADVDNPSNLVPLSGPSDGPIAKISGVQGFFVYITDAAHGSRAMAVPDAGPATAAFQLNPPGTAVLGTTPVLTEQRMIL